MDKPDFRALCAELVTAFKDESTYTQRVEILDRARAALATAPPEPPTDMALEPSFSQRQQLLQGLSHYLRGGGDE